MGYLTKKQEELYNYIKQYIEKNKWAPSIKEMAKEFGVLPNAIFGQLKSLEKKKYIKRGRNMSRAIKVL